jgi:hypothetical protein
MAEHKEKTMSSTYGDIEKCEFDGKACPFNDPKAEAATSFRTACSYYYECRGGYYAWLVCSRHPEKAKAVAEESQEWYRQRMVAAEAAPEEWDALQEEFRAIMALFRDDAKKAADAARSAGRVFVSHLEFLDEEAESKALEPWYAKRDALIAKYNPV